MPIKLPPNKASTKAATKTATKATSTKTGSSRAKSAVEHAQLKKKTGIRSKNQKVVASEKKSLKPNKTAITHCVQEELRRYYEMLDGEEPSNVYQLVIRQAEHALIDSVMRECSGNQSKATKWLGISRGTLRNKLAEMGYD